MFRRRYIHTCVALGATALVCFTFAACSSDSSDQSLQRVRRSNQSTTTTKPKSKSTTSTVAPQQTSSIVSVPFLPSDQLGQTWTQANLCGLIPADQAQDILGMATVPEPKYSFSSTTGARCTFPTGSGDEMYIEISTNSFAGARAVDAALNINNTQIVISGVGGVANTNKATGTTYFLNVSGADSNQWITNAPKESQTKELSQALISSLT